MLHERLPHADQMRSWTIVAVLPLPWCCPVCHQAERLSARLSSDKYAQVDFAGRIALQELCAHCAYPGQQRCKSVKTVTPPQGSLHCFGEIMKVSEVGNCDIGIDDRIVG